MCCEQFQIFGNDFGCFQDFQNINWENRSLDFKLQDFKLTEKCFYNEIPLNL